MSNQIQETDLFDRINSYYTNQSKLSPTDTKIAERWELSFALLLEHRNRRTAIIKHLALAKSKGNPISKAQAYRDMVSAERIFAPIRQYTKEFLRLVLLESAFRDVKDAERRARRATSDSAWFKFMEIKNKAEYRIIQVSGISEAHPDIPDFSKIQATQFNLNIPEDVLEIMKNVIGKGRIDVTELLAAANKIEDVEAVEIKEKK